MKEGLVQSLELRLQQSSLSDTTRFLSQNEVFFCPEESQFYSHCLELLVLNQCLSSERIIEFGSGDGSPVINSLLRSQFNSLIYGYELNRSACELAQARIQQYKLDKKYVVYPSSFFESARPAADYLVANPPYLPAPDSKILMPLLHGGRDGSGITKQLLSLDYQNVLLMISAYSNPVGTIAWAAKNDYYVADFLIQPLKFGYYSSECKVKKTILELQKSNQAFFSENVYFLAGVLFRKQHEGAIDLSHELLQVMTVLEPAC